MWKSLVPHRDLYDLDPAIEAGLDQDARPGTDWTPVAIVEQVQGRACCCPVCGTQKQNIASTTPLRHWQLAKFESYVIKYRKSDAAKHVSNLQCPTSYSERSTMWAPKA